MLFSSAVSYLIEGCSSGLLRCCLLFRLALAVSALAVSTLSFAAEPAGGAMPSTNESRALQVINQKAREQGSPLFHESFVETATGTLHFVSAGEGRPVVFYHGFPSFWYAWAPQLLALSTQYRVIAFDGLGSNLSSMPADTSSYEIEALAAQLRSAIETLVGDERVTLIGHDWGGALTWSYAQAYPETLHQQVVLSAPPLNLFMHLLETNRSQRRASAYVARLKDVDYVETLAADGAKKFTAAMYKQLLDKGFLSEEDYGLFEEALALEGQLRATTAWYRANLPDFKSITDADYWPSRDASADVDTLLIWGAKDKVFVDDFLDLADQYAHPLRIEVLKGVGHAPMAERAAQVNALIAEFLASETQVSPD